MRGLKFAYCENLTHKNAADCDYVKILLRELKHAIQFVYNPVPSYSDACVSSDNVFSFNLYSAGNEVKQNRHKLTIVMLTYSQYSFLIQVVSLRVLSVYSFLTNVVLICTLQQLLFVHTLKY